MGMRLQCSPLNLVLVAWCLVVDVCGFRVREATRQNKDLHKSWQLERHLEQQLKDVAKNSSNVTVQEGGNEKKNSSTKGPEAERPLPPYHMKENTGLQEQGFKGDDVEHNDMETHTADWQKEYGPKHSNYKTMAEICKDYPKNPSCMDYQKEPEPVKAPAPAAPALPKLKSSAEGKMASLVLSISLLLLQAH